VRGRGARARARAGGRPVGSNGHARRESRIVVGMKFQTVHGRSRTRVSVESMEEGSLFIRGSRAAGRILTKRGTLLWIKSDMKAGGARDAHLE
jgi:hypothetical protein